MSEPLKISSSNTNADETNVLPHRPFWLSVLRWMAWWLMLIAVIAFLSRHGGGAFIYQNY
jgi:hypothetical protein